MALWEASPGDCRRNPVDAQERVSDSDKDRAKAEDKARAEARLKESVLSASNLRNLETPLINPISVGSTGVLRLLTLHSPHAREGFVSFPCKFCQHEGKYRYVVDFHT